MIEVQGNGTIVSREIRVSSFIRLHLSGKGLIELYQSDEEKVVVETDENLQDYFTIVNSGRTLYVATENKFRRLAYTHCTIKVFLRQIDMLYIRNEHADVVCPREISLFNPLEIKVQSVGNTELHLTTPAIKLLCQSVGNVVMKGTCHSIDIKNQSKGDFRSTQLFAEELSLKNKAEGNVEVFANREITISHFGKGYVHYMGNAVVNDVKQYGEGEVIHT